MIEYELAQTEALFDVLNKSNAYFFRRIVRWYSTTFHTPLHIVESLPWYEILQHYYESQYEKMNETELLELLQELIPALADQKEKDMDDFMKEVMEMNQKAEEKKQAKKQEQQEIVKNFDIQEEDV